MSRTAFRTEEVPAPARQGAWEAALTGFAIDSRIAEDYPRLEGDGLFCGVVDSYRSPRGLSFSILESGPQRLSATPGRFDEIFWLSMVLEGESSIEIDGERHELAPGDIVYGKRGAEGALDIRTPFRMLNANIPSDVIAQNVFVPLPNKVLRLPSDSGTNLVLGRMLGAIADSIDRLEDDSAFAIEGALVQLLVSSLFDGTGEAKLGGTASARAALLQRVWRSIEARLGDSDLGIADIAEAHQLSVRYIQLLFEENGQCFRTYVRRRRLEKCRKDLADPLNANVSITNICLHWGFGDSASFSRAFRDEFAMSPSEYRRTAVQGSPRNLKQRLHGVSYQAS